MLQHRATEKYVSSKQSGTLLASLTVPQWENKTRPSKSRVVIFGAPRSGFSFELAASAAWFVAFSWGRSMLNDGR